MVLYHIIVFYKVKKLTNAQHVTLSGPFEIFPNTFIIMSLNKSFKQQNWGNKKHLMSQRKMSQVRSRIAKSKKFLPLYSQIDEIIASVYFNLHRIAIYDYYVCLKQH